MSHGAASGPLLGVRVVEFAGIGPAPFCTMLLSDLGADIVRIDRPDTPGAQPQEVPARGRRSVALDLKTASGLGTALQLIERADVLIEGFRPGVMERLELGPQTALARNPLLIYGRMTGWGQSGPLAHTAGHDINYIALTGALAAIGPAAGPPSPPLNLLGDYGGGALYLALGITAALFERTRSGRGQVVDAAIVDGVSSLLGMSCWLHALGAGTRRGESLLDGSAHFYRCYECQDGRYVAVGALEPRFYELLCQQLTTYATTRPPGQEPSHWRHGGEVLAAIFKTRTRAEWCALLENTDACFAPVLEIDEAPQHEHLRHRASYVTEFGLLQPAPAPRFSRTPGAIQGPPPSCGQGGQDALRDWGIDG